MFAGLLEIGVGVAVLVWPDPTLLVVAAVIGWWVLFGGVMTTAGSIGARSILPYWGLFLVFGLVEAAIGIWLLERPGLTLVATVLAIGFWSIFYGVMQITVGVELKQLPTRLESIERQFTTAGGRSGGAVVDGELRCSTRSSSRSTARSSRWGHCPQRPRSPARQKPRSASPLWCATSASLRGATRPSKPRSSSCRRR